MAELSNVKSDGVITDALLHAALPVFAKATWEWFDAHKDDVLFQKRVLFFSFDIKVSSFEGIITTLFGPKESATPTT